MRTFAGRMLFQSYALFAGVLLSAAAYAALREWAPRAVRGREALLLVVNALVLLTLVKEHTLIVLAVLGLSVYGAGALLERKGSRWGLAAAVTLLVGLFAVRNYPFLHEALGPLKGPVLSVQKLGLSYILFRWIHFLVESHRGTIRARHWLTFLNYTFFFPTILAGPIDRYANFHYGVVHRPRPAERWSLLAGVWRVGLGAVKTLVLVPVVKPWAVDWESVPVEHPVAAMALGLVSYSAFILLDFSGYSDIAIGTARWMGIRTPENFDWPYASRNLAEFWRRWHMTFSKFLRAYVFKPVVAALNRWPALARQRMVVTALAYLITFVVCGLWHGDRLHFVVWGAWHGMGLVLNKLWRDRWRPLAWRGRWYDGASVVATWGFVTLGWGWFHYPLSAWAEWMQAWWR